MEAKSVTGFHVNIEVDAEDLRLIDSRLAKMRASLTGTEAGRYLSDEARPYLRDRAIVRFSREGDDAVGRWAPLSKATRGIRKKLARYYGWPIQPAHPINQRSGELRSFVIGTQDLRRSESEATLTVPRVSSSRRLNDKMRAAQTGTPTGRKLARPVVGLSERDRADLTMLAERWWERIIQGL